MILEVSEQTLINKRKFTFLNTPTRIACFVSTEEQIKDVFTSLNDIDSVALSVRCLIEHIAAEPSNGKRILSNSTIDDLIATMEQIISWGMIGDQIKFDLFESDLEVLPSGRLGTDHTITKEVFEPFRMAKAKEDVIDSIKDFESKFEERVYNPENSVPAKLDEAFLEEYGVSLTKMLDFCHALTHIAFQNHPGTTCLNEEDLKKEVRKLIPDISEKQIDHLLDYFSLKGRGNVTKVPDGFFDYDISPWRYNRGLALLRKPLIEVIVDTKEKLFFWGPRQVIVTREQLLFLFYSGKLRAKPGGKLSSLIGHELNAKGKKFTLAVYNFVLKNIEDVITDKEVLINPSAFLKSEEDLGDVDVLVIDTKQNVVFLIECKKTEVAKNMKQIVEEVNNLFGSESKKSWIEKHQRRFNWLTSNKELLGKKYKVNLDKFQIVPVVLTSEDLSTKYLKKNILPFKMGTFYEFEESKLESLI